MSPQPRRIDDVADLLEAIDQERTRDPLLDCTPIMVVGSHEGDPFTIDGAYGLQLTSRELTAYVEDAEQIRCDLAEHHAGCIPINDHVAEVDRLSREVKHLREQLRRPNLKEQQ